MEPDSGHSALEKARINRALGLFLLFFAAVVGVAVLFTETAAGRWTNAVAALVLGGIGGVLFRSRG